jgi:hypothetical protein
VNRRWWAVLPLALASLAAGGVPSLAAPGGVGAGVGASPVVLGTTAEPGRSYALPAVLVVNTGSQTSTYRLTVEEVGRPKGRVVPPGWVHFEHNDFALAPRASLTVPTMLTVAPGAAQGRYASDILVSTVDATPTRSGARVGAQAATELRFQVGGSTEAGARSAGTVLPWWAFLAAGLVAIVLLFLWLTRRKGYRLRLERRR